MPVYPFRCKKCGHEEEVCLSIMEYGIYNLIPQLCVMCVSNGEESYMVRVFTPVAIVGLSWDWKKGYRTGIDDPVSEVKFDMMKLEQKATETGNLKEFRKKQKALKFFAEANSEILQ